MSLEEFLKLPEEKPYLELYQGVVRQKVSPKGQHSALETDLAGFINYFGRPRRIARAFTELRGIYGRFALVPDVAVYRWSRITRLPDGTIANDFDDPPDIAIEIVSPGQRVGDLEEKCRWYLEHGVEIAMLVNPLASWVRLYRQDGITATLRGDERIDLDSVLPGFELTVQALFDTLRD
jgi:Uma2 family endonuclease